MKISHLMFVAACCLVVAGCQPTKEPLQTDYSTNQRPLMTNAAIPGAPASGR